MLYLSIVLALRLWITEYRVATACKSSDNLERTQYLFVIEIITQLLTNFIFQTTWFNFHFSFSFSSLANIDHFIIYFRVSVAVTRAWLGGPKSRSSRA